MPHPSYHGKNQPFPTIFAYNSMYVPVCVHMCLYMRLYVCFYVCLFICVFVCVFVCVSMAAVCVHVRLLSCLLTCRPMCFLLRQKECLLRAPLHVGLCASGFARRSVCLERHCRRLPDYLANIYRALV